MYCNFVELSYTILHLLQVASTRQTMSFKRSFYTVRGFKPKKRKLSCGQCIDDSDENLAGISYFVIFL